MQLTDDLVENDDASPRRECRSSLTRDSKALDPAAFATCMAELGPFEDEPFLAIAVSGGPDSLALTLLADHWARHKGGRVVGLTVDHGLRAGSADEARKTGQWLSARGIGHHVLPWRGDKPTSGLQRRAREARYALLADWCHRHRCLHLMTAHHREDQAETVAIRKARKSGAAGLAAMAAIREMPGLRLLRPLLGIAKGRLARSLQVAGQPWIDDPSNDDPAFTRNRLRQADLDVDALAAEAEQQGIRRQAADRRVAAALVQNVILDPAGFAALDRAGFDQLDTELALDLLTRLLMTVGGRPYPPRRRSLSRLYQAMREGRPEATLPTACTLAHCRILEHRKRWLICREHASPDHIPLEPGKPRRWDDRFVVTLAADRQGLTMNALGDGTRLSDNALISKENTRRLPGAVKPTLPAIRDGLELIAIPHLGLYDPSLGPESLDLRFCPHTPLANAPFMPHITR